MSRPRALDLFSGAGGVSVGLERAGFDVTAVDIRPMPHHRGGTFHQADALTFPLDGYAFIWASPPCQAHSALRHLQKGEYPDLIPQTRMRLVESGIPYCIENVEGAPLGASGFLIMLCGTMFGLQTPDGRAELRRHRLFETSFSIALRPSCQHGHVSMESLSVNGTGLDSGKERWALRRERGTTGKPKVLTVVGHTPVDNTRKRPSISVVGPKGLPGISHARRAISVTGNTAQTNTVRNTERQTFSTEDARAAMGIDWMPMKYLSQAIPPAYAEWIGRQAIDHLTKGGN